MLQSFANNAETNLTAGIDTGDTTLSVVDASAFPAIGGGQWFWATLTNASADETQWEIVKVTVRDGENFTVTRGQQGTTARAWGAGDKVELRATAADYERSWDKYLAHATDSLGSSTGSSFSVTPEEQNLSYESGQKVKVFHYRYVGPTAYLDQFTGQVLSYDGVTLTIYNATYSGDDGPYTNWTIDRWVDPVDFNLAPVASSNDYLDLDNLPTLGTAAEHAQEDFATAAQGAKADTAIQPEDLGSAVYVDTSVFQPSDATLTALAALTIAADTLTIGTGADAFSQITFAANTFPAKGSTGNLVAKTISDTGLSLVAGADAAAMRTTLGLGTLATQSGTFSGTSSGTNTGDQTITLTGEVTGSGTGSFAATIDKSIAPTWTAAHTWSLNVAATSTDGIVLATSATATLNNQKNSPALKQTGSAWVTGSVNAAMAVGMLVELVPVQGWNKWYNFNLSYKGSYDGGAYTELWRYDGGLNALVIGATRYGYASVTSGDWSFNITVGSSVLAFPGSRNEIKQGADAATPSADYFTAANGSGTNKAGTTRYILGSLATGNAASGGIEWHTGDPGASGSTLQTATKKMGLDGTGLFDLTNTTDATSSTAGALKTAGGLAVAKKIIAGAQMRPGTYTVATLPAGTAGDIAYATDARKVGEGAGAGTGSHVLYSNGQWRIPEDQSTAVA